MRERRAPDLVGDVRAQDDLFPFRAVIGLDHPGGAIELGVDRDLQVGHDFRQYRCDYGQIDRADEDRHADQRKYECWMLDVGFWILEERTLHI